MVQNIPCKAGMEVFLFLNAYFDGKFNFHRNKKKREEERKYHICVYSFFFSFFFPLLSVNEHTDINKGKRKEAENIATINHIHRKQKRWIQNCNCFLFIYVLCVYVYLNYVIMLDTWEYTEYVLVEHQHLVQSSLSFPNFSFQKSSVFVNWIHQLVESERGLHWCPSVLVISSMLCRFRWAKKSGDNTEYVGLGLGSSSLILCQVSWNSHRDGPKLH